MLSRMKYSTALRLGHFHGHRHTRQSRPNHIRIGLQKLRLPAETFLHFYQPLQPGYKILINGAGGGVGTFGVQIAKSLYTNVEVTGVDNTGKLEMMRSVGFDRVIDYTKEDFTKNGLQYDLIIDNKTYRPLFSYKRALRPRGMYIMLGGSMLRVLQILLLAPLVSLFWKKKMCVLGYKPNKDLAYLKELVESGKVKPVIHGPYKLDEVPDAFRIFGEGDHNGKLVITLTNK